MLLSVRLYYAARPLLPRRLQLAFRRLRTRRMLSSCADVWPILPEAAEPPRDWSGWPGQKQFALVLTHDVDTAKGQANCERLVEMEQELGFRSALYFVPERYPVRADLRDRLVAHGFEVGVHGLKHDGKLYSSKAVFQQRAVRINEYLRQWNCRGFRSPAMHCNLDWLRSLDIDYDASTFDTDPFEPFPSGVGTIYPFLVPGGQTGNGYVELPYTLPQDSTLFLLMQESGIEIWKTKLDWIAANGGMALLTTHPDYMDFDGRRTFDTYPAERYSEFLHYAKDKYEGRYWHTLPKDMARFWIDSMANVERLHSDETCDCAVHA